MSAAQSVGISGFGRFGIDYNEANKGANQDEGNLTSRLELNLKGSTQSDAGVTFGGKFRVRADNTDGTPNTATFNGGQVYAVVGPTTIEFGNVSGAVDSMENSIGTGVDGMGFLSSVVEVPLHGYSSGGEGDSNGVALIYSMGGATFHVSSTSTNDRVGARIQYDMNGWSFRVGAQDSYAENEKVIVGSIRRDLGFAMLEAHYANNQNLAINGDDVNKYRLSASVPLAAATTLTAWGAHQNEPFVGQADGASFGLHLTHDLGGDVNFLAGVVEPTNDDAVQAQAGVSFNF